MKIINNENIRPFDVDGTLVSAVKGSLTPLPHAYIYDPITKKEIKVRVHEAMVRLLKEEKHRGSYVIVWSRGGYEWAANVIKALELTQYVDQIMSKPTIYFDDVPVKKWLKDRVYIGPDEIYKK